ncbi:MAG: DUF255 domain-containing protein [Chitinivibrionales bacterium]|nr:DUF255 domain-containing protein [Chitinivibrionales bacterium]
MVAPDRFGRVRRRLRGVFEQAVQGVQVMRSGYRLLWLTVSVIAFAVHGQIDLGAALEQGAGANREPVEVVVRRLETGAPDTVALELTLRMPDDVHVYADDSLFFRIAHSSLVGVDSPAVVLPRSHAHTNFDSTTVQVYTDGQSFRLYYPVRAPQWHVVGSIRYQACNDALCFMPTTKEFKLSTHSDIAVAGAAGEQRRVGREEWQALVDEFEQAGAVGGYRSVEQFAAFLEDPSSGAAQGGGVLAGKSMWLVIAIVLIGGVALNLTPCVLPMLPITLAVIGAGAGNSDRRRGLLVGALYGSGMAIAYGALGATVVMTGATFGAHNASPVFNLAIAVLFVVMSLAMFDIIHIDLTRYRSGIKQPGAGKATSIGVFAMGAVTALLAGACVAPVVIAVILYASSLYAEGNRIAPLLPFLLGIGMALPWPFAGAGLTMLPKPGRWMVWVRNTFGVLILAVALYYGYTGLQLLRGAPDIAESVEAVSVPGEELEWHKSLSDGLSRALEEDKPVLVDFWATWCKNCHAMDATTFRDSTVQAKLRDFVLVKYQAEDPAEEPAKSILEHFGAVGLPTYVVLRPK